MWLTALPLTAVLALPSALAAAPGDVPEARPLSCGVPVLRSLAADARHAFGFSVPEGTAVVVQASDVSGMIGLIRLRATGLTNDRETCSGVLDFVSPGGVTLLEVSDCVGHDKGIYGITLSVVSDSRANCGRPLACGSTPDGVGLADTALPNSDTPGTIDDPSVVVPAGEVDSYTFPGVAGETVTLAVTDLEDQIGAIRLRLFDPDGRRVPRGESCARSITVALPETGMYTLLVSACGPPHGGPYRLSFDDFTCPEGPNITYFGIATADSFPLFPVGFDAAGRPVYFRTRGNGLSLVLEAKRGADRRAVGATTFDPPGLPDLQMLVSRPLGNGSRAVCDITAETMGGVPATVPFAFSDTHEVIDAVNDLGCRFNDGQGNALGRSPGIEACTRSDDPDLFGFGFVDPTSAIQYCTDHIPKEWAFPPGGTIVAARVRDESGMLGAPREIIVLVATPTKTSTESKRTATATKTRVPTHTSTQSPTRTRTSTWTPTPGHTFPVTVPPSFSPEPTPTATPISQVCTGDCNKNGKVTINELTLAVKIFLGRDDIEACPAVDKNRDGIVAINELIASVKSALSGCSGIAAPR